MLCRIEAPIFTSFTKIGYAADWSEYNNHQLGGGALLFNLDPLWSDANIDFIGIDPARALYWAAVVNGILAAPLMAVMMLIVSNPRAMGRLTLKRVPMVLGWIATAVMAVATAIYFATAL